MQTVREYFRTNERMGAQTRFRTGSEKRSYTRPSQDENFKVVSTRSCRFRCVALEQQHSPVGVLDSPVCASHVAPGVIASL